MKNKLMKNISLNDIEDLQIRNDEASPNKMIIEGYPIVFNKWTKIYNKDGSYNYECIIKEAFSKADITDVCLKYNHNDNVFILARTRNKSLILTIDDHGVFMHAELIDTTTNRDVYEMVKSGLLTEGSFAFTINDNGYRLEEKDGEQYVTITDITYLFDVAICPNGAYGELTEIYARSYNMAEAIGEKAEALKRCELLRLKNINKIKIMEAKR